MTPNEKSIKSRGGNMCEDSEMGLFEWHLGGGVVGAERRMGTERR